MNEKKTVAISTQNPTQKAKPSLTPEQVKEIIFPDLSPDSFQIGEKTFGIRVLPWRWESAFRRHAVPIITEEFKPFERALYVFASNAHLYSEDLGIAKAAGKSEVDGDAYLTNAVIVICMSQDELIRASAASGKEVSQEETVNLERKYRVIIENLALPDGRTRHFLREIVRKQSEKQKLVQTLGESWIARLGELSVLTGTEKTFDSLKRDFTRQVQNFMGKVGSIVGTTANSFSQSTDNGSEKQPPEKRSTKTQTTETREDAADADQEAEQPEAIPATAE